MNNTNAKTFAEIAKAIYRFTNRTLAFSFASGCVKPMWVMHGDDGKYWVATPANCQRLERMGYEFAL